MMRFLFGLLLALVVSLVYPVSVRAGDGEQEDGKGETIEIKNVATSSFFTASPTFNFDSTAPLTANYAIFAGSGTMGPITGQGVSQSKPQIVRGSTVSCLLPDGSMGIVVELVGHIASTRFERTGDLLFEKAESLTGCFNTTTFVFHEEVISNITGGTGRFTGATGKEIAIQDGGFLPSGAPSAPEFPHGNGTFGFSHGTFTLTIKVAK